MSKRRIRRKRRARVKILPLILVGVVIARAQELRQELTQE